MYKKTLFYLFLIGFLSLTSAQKKEITLEEIWSGTFRTERLDVLRSMKNGKQYTILNFNRGDGTSSLDKYDYGTQQKVETVVSSSAEIPNFTSYEFSVDESKIILATDVEPIFRRSQLGVYYVYDVSSKGITKISDNKIQEPALSPDGSKVAFVWDNNLYIFEISSKTTKQITTDGSYGTIINGVTDWVYEEEFGFVKAFAWNSDGTKIAFMRFDETQVPHFSMDVYGE
ncbi:MAG: DPP IV N-terminal domain-containing protein, partial [Bacteroidota bacterium]